MEYLVSNEQDMQGLVVGVLSMFKRLRSETSKFGVRVVALNGELGAGKTTFTKMLAKELGIVEHITSPTFVIQKSYKIPTKSNDSSLSLMFTKLVHIDAYRLSGAGDMVALDFDTTLAGENTLVLIEWAENIKSALPVATISINFEYINESTRRITIDGILEGNGKKRG